MLALLTVVYPLCAGSVDYPIAQLGAGDRPSHVILSASAYQQLISRLEELEENSLNIAAETALNQSSMVGSEEFTATLEKLANG